MPSTSAALERFPSESTKTREMKRRSNSRLASENRMPLWTISSISRSSFSFISRVLRQAQDAPSLSRGGAPRPASLVLLEFQPAQEPKRLDVFVARLHNDVVGQR